MDRVQKILSNSGYCSRRKAEELIQQGRVKVNGKRITIGDKATEKDIITVNGQRLKKERKVYLLFNKPLKCVTALQDKKYKTVMEYIKIKERVFPVGRLDYNTSGLLLLTNDGDFANNVMHPSKKIKKEYLVQTKERIISRQIMALEKGVKLEDGMTAPAKVQLLSPNLMKIVIHEGRNRIIRRMCEKVKLRVTGLTRIRIGKLDLGQVKVGRYRVLNKKDIDRIFI